MIRAVRIVAVLIGGLAAAHTAAARTDLALELKDAQAALAVRDYTTAYPLYLRAAELKRAGLDWTQVIPLTPENRRQRLVVELKADHNFQTEEARVREFAHRGGGCRATYFNHARRLRKRGLAI